MNDEWKIYWTAASDAYRFGSDTLMKAKDEVAFYNPLMPPGTAIMKWRSKTNFQANRQEPTLPYLDENCKYVLQRDCISEGTGSCFVRLVFFDQFDVKLGDLIIREEVEVFECPPDTDHYEMELINGGIQKLTFHSITIQEVADENETKTSEEVL